MIKRIDYIKKINSEIKLEKVAIYDDEDVTEKEVNHKIDFEEYHPKIIFCYKEQFENVFKSLIKSKKKKK